MQFRLQTLFLLFVVLWSSLAVFGGAGIGVFVLAIAAALILNKARNPLTALLLLGLVLLFCLLLLLPAKATALGAVRRFQCYNNLTQIALAMRNYDAKYGCFPPAYIADKNSRPMHSWRVLLLPFFDDQSLKSLYDQYDFNEPWDGLHNRKLLSTRPPIYVCPANESILVPGNTQTSYVVIVGPHAAFRKNAPRSFSELSKLASTTVLVAETASRIDWTEPKDILLDAIKSSGSLSDSATVSSKHGCYRHDFFYDYESDSPYVACVAAVDGHASCLPSAAFLSPQLPTFLKVGGFDEDEIGKIPEPTHYRASEFKATIHWQNLCALAVWIASVGALFYRARRSRKRKTPEKTGDSTAGC